MAPLPPQNTARHWIDYNDGYNDHSLLVRHGPAVSSIEVLNSVVPFFEAIAPLLYLITITGARAAPINSVLSVPVAWPGAATYGAFLMPEDLTPRQLCFLGRTSTGRRARWFLFGYNEPPPGPFRLTQTDHAEIGEAIQAIISAQAEDVFLAIDGNDPQMYPYADVNYNSYWEAEARG